MRTDGMSVRMLSRARKPIDDTRIRVHELLGSEPDVLPDDLRAHVLEPQRVHTLRADILLEHPVRDDRFQGLSVGGGSAAGRLAPFFDRDFDERLAS